MFFDSSTYNQNEIVKGKRNWKGKNHFLFFRCNKAVYSYSINEELTVYINNLLFYLNSLRSFVIGIIPSYVSRMIARIFVILINPVKMCGL